MTALFVPPSNVDERKRIGASEGEEHQDALVFGEGAKDAQVELLRVAGAGSSSLPTRMR
jgi:hypothetical protein